MIEMGKKYQTRDGQEVRLLCADGPDKNEPVIGIIAYDVDVSTWQADGRFMPPYIDDDPADLIPVPAKHEGWGVLRIVKGAGACVVLKGGMVFEEKESAERVLKHEEGEYPNQEYTLGRITWEG
jgi:hypothetical protein